MLLRYAPIVVLALCRAVSAQDTTSTTTTDIYDDIPTPMTLDAIADDTSSATSTTQIDDLPSTTTTANGPVTTTTATSPEDATTSTTYQGDAPTSTTIQDDDDSSATTPSPQVTSMTSYTPDMNIEFKTYGNNTYANTPAAPYISALSYVWTRAFDPVVAGTVVCETDVKGSTVLPCNTTYSTQLLPTDNTNVFPNGTLSIFTRTDLNSDGTVTKVTNVDGTDVTLTYPTQLLVGRNTIVYATLTSILHTDGATCCKPTTIATPGPTGISSVELPVRTNAPDPDDPYGVLYELDYRAYSSYFSGYDTVASLVAPLPLETAVVTQTDCMLPLCALDRDFVTATVTAVKPVKALLETRNVPAPSRSSDNPPPVVVDPSPENPPPVVVDPTPVEPSPENPPPGDPSPDPPRPGAGTGVIDNGGTTGNTGGDNGGDGGGGSSGGGLDLGGDNGGGGSGGAGDSGSDGGSTGGGDGGVGGDSPSNSGGQSPQPLQGPGGLDASTGSSDTGSTGDQSGADDQFGADDSSGGIAGDAQAGGDETGAPPGDDGGVGAQSSSDDSSGTGTDDQFSPDPQSNGNAEGQSNDDPSAITLGPTTFTALPDSAGFAADGLILVPGSAPITISGTTYSLGPDGSVVTTLPDGSVTTSPPADATDDVGGYIMTGLGGGTDATRTLSGGMVPPAQQTTNGGSRKDAGRVWWTVWLGMVGFLF